MRWYQIDIGGWLVALLRVTRQIKSVWMPTKEERIARLRKPSRRAARQAQKSD
jgi:hypothetical protein